MSEDINSFIKFQIKRKITNLFKSFLQILDDLEFEQYNISKEQLARYRKRTLDHSNDVIRELEHDLSKFDIIFKIK